MISWAPDSWCSSSAVPGSVWETPVTEPKQLRIMFVCTGNSARSQMAEGMAREMGYDAYSSGTEPATVVNPNAIVVMGELGVDISAHATTQFDLAAARLMDVVVTVCGNAEVHCPVLPVSVRRMHWPLFDPASAEGDSDHVLSVFRRIRNEIKTRLDVLSEMN
ncbi:MAG: arsenate reductase ArsC [Candidatus Latescibacteria bacterium]|nr:arsenate reductase ArsC [Candidatus Latescibacterota bacterium]